MRRIDGRDVRDRLDIEADIVVVGSGPAGSSVAREAAGAGAKVVVIEAGPWVEPDQFPVGTFSSMAQTYRDMGTSIVLGRAPIPYLQGKMVGGSSPINGAICWRLPRDVHSAWLAADPALSQALPWETIERITDDIEARLGVAPTEDSVAGRKNLLMAKGAEALGLDHRPIRRNVTGCEGLGRCIQGCPKGLKASVDVTLLDDAMRDGTTVASSVEVRHIEHRRGKASGVRGRAAGGGEVRVRARRAVVVAASAVQSPALLMRSRIRHGPVGEHFQCHPGVSMAGRFDTPVRMWEGATQGHEVTGLRHEGLKFEALGFGLGVLASRLEGVGARLADGIAELAHWTDWGAAIKAEAHGRVRLVLGKPVVFFTPSAHDVQRFRRGLRVLGDLLFAAGARILTPGVKGFDASITDPSALVRLEREGPSRPARFQAAITHMFGTCKMGSDPASSVVRPDFRHSALDRLYVADSSVFPTNLGVNPQIPIMAMATLCARRIVQSRH